MGCPFGAVFMLVVAAGGRRAVKCDGCRDTGGPWCVRHCPTGALRAGEQSDVVAVRVRCQGARWLHGTGPDGCGGRRR